MKKLLDKIFHKCGIEELKKINSILQKEIAPIIISDTQSIKEEISRVSAIQVPKRSYSFSDDYMERKLISYNVHLRLQKDPYLPFKEPKTDFHSSLIDILNEEKENKDGCRIILLSIAGYGKTYEMEHAAGVFSQEKEKHYPIKSYLKDYQGQSIPELLSIYQPKWEQLLEDNLLLLLDGLDEIAPRLYAAFINHLNQFAEAKPKTNIILSSRYNFYDLVNNTLRNFDIYILDDFTETNIEEYIELKLRNRGNDFKRKLVSGKMRVYSRNPFYLSKLVRYFGTDEKAFPKNNAELFDKIIFERYNTEKKKRNLVIKKEKLLSLMQHVAIVMTSMGRNSFDNDEMETLIPNAEDLEAIKHLSLINRHDVKKDAWSFEHKNLQEYLTATYLQTFSLRVVKQFITYPYDENTVQPHYLNTLSFLFSMVNIEEDFFKELFDWLTQKQPELLVRFEKDKMPAGKRFDAFTHILSYYKKNELGFYASSNFQISELAAFVDWDNQLLDFLEKEIFKKKTPDWFLCDCISLLSGCPKPYLLRSRIETLIIKSLDFPGRLPRIYGVCIGALKDLGWNNKNNFELILAKNIDMTDFVVRRPLVDFIAGTDYAEEYYDFFLKSVPIYEEGQEGMTYGMANESLAKQITEFKSAPALKATLQFILEHSAFLPVNAHSKEVHTNSNGLAKLLANCMESSKENIRIIGLVYRIYHKYPHFSFRDKDWFEPFYNFFSHTCGTQIIFNKLYRYHRKKSDVMHFADEVCCDFLLSEYETGKIDDSTFSMLRNVLSHVNHSLYVQFNEKLKTALNGKFYTPVKDFNYQEHQRLYKIKNQQMLLDKSCFLSEINEIFKILGKQSFTDDDLYIRKNEELFRFNDSIVKEWLFGMFSRKTPRTKAQILKMIETETQWNNFRIHKIEEWLSHASSNKIVLDKELMTFAKEWCKNEIHQIDFTNAIKQTKKSEYQFSFHAENVIRLYCLVNPEIEDPYLLKMLEADIGFYDNTNSNSLSKIIATIARNKHRLKQQILDNLKKGLVVPVLMNHFAICHEWGYYECLPELFNAITINAFLEDYNKKKLTEYYIKLGGSIKDFKSYVELPLIDNDRHFTSWNWFLIEELLPAETAFICDLLFTILKSKNYTDETNHYCAELLLRASRLEGLHYWSDWILIHLQQPFNIGNEKNTQQLGVSDYKNEAETLINTLVFSYQKNLNVRWPESIERAAIICLNEISVKGFEQMKFIETTIQKEMHKHKAEKFSKHLAFQREKILQNFYKKMSVSTNINEAILSLTKLNNIELI